MHMDSDRENLAQRHAAEREQLFRLRASIEQEIESMIDLLDMIDPDADLEDDGTAEPPLGSVERPSQLRWSEGSRDPGEAEPSLGSTELRSNLTGWSPSPTGYRMDSTWAPTVDRKTDQRAWGGGPTRNADLDLEDQHDGAEPDVDAEPDEDGEPTLGSRDQVKDQDESWRITAPWGYEHDEREPDDPPEASDNGIADGGGLEEQLVRHHRLGFEWNPWAGP